MGLSSSRLRTVESQSTDASSNLANPTKVSQLFDTKEEVMVYSKYDEPSQSRNNTNSATDICTG